MGKFIIISLALLIFLVSFYFGRSTEIVEVRTASEKPIPPLGKINKVLQTKTPKAEILTDNIKSDLSKIRQKDRYKKLAQIANIYVQDHPLLNTLIGLENPKLIDHQAMEEIYQDLQDRLKRSPDEGFREINNILNSPLAKEDPALRGNLMVAASFIEGKEEEVKEIALREMTENIIPEEVDNQSVGRVITNQKQKTGEDMAVVMAYNAYLSASHKDLQNVDMETIQIIKKQPNKNLQRLLAMSYDRAFPQNRELMLNKLKEEGISLFSEDFKVNINEK